MARINFITGPPAHPTERGVTTAKRGGNYYIRNYGNKPFHVKPKQHRQNTIFAYANHYWTHSLPSGVKADWNAAAAGLNFVQFGPTTIPGTGQLFYLRSVIIGLYNNVYSTGFVDVPNPAPYPAVIIPVGNTIVGSSIITTNYFPLATDPFDYCFAWITFPTRGPNPPLTATPWPCGWQEVQQNGVPDGMGGWYYTQYWDDPFSLNRAFGSPCIIWFMWFSFKFPTPPLSNYATVS
jgi:hypothetical protein